MQQANDPKHSKQLYNRITEKGKKKRIKVLQTSVNLINTVKTSGPDKAKQEKKKCLKLLLLL